MGLLLVLFPFAEIYLFFKFIDAYSFLDAVLLVVLSGFVGALIIRILGPATLSSLQTDLSQGRLPANQLLHRSLVIIGGFLLFIPGILSDVLGALCILPGSRHLIAFYIKHLVKKGLFKGRVFMSGFGMPGGPGRQAGGFGTGTGDGFRTGGPGRHSRGFGHRSGGQQTWEEPRYERDAEVVEVKPLEITHKNLPPNGHSDDSDS